MKYPCVYIMSNRYNGTLYVGVTSNIRQRVFQHKQGTYDGFTKKYNTHHLVYYEQHATMESAIMREKQLKGGSRKRKNDCIESINPKRDDLYTTIVDL